MWWVTSEVSNFSRKALRSWSWVTVKTVSFRQRVWPLQHGEHWCLAMKKQISITQWNPVWSVPDFKGMMSDPPWTDWCAHCLEYIERHLVATGNVMSFILLYWFSQVYRGHLKSGEYHDQSLVMLQWENCDFKLNGAPWWQRSSPWKMKRILKGLDSLKCLEIWRTPPMWWALSCYFTIFLE